jgi:F0F1-type ATP synthase membrane subunit b/b'
MIRRKRAAAVLLVLPFLLFLSSEEGARTSAGLDLLGKTINFLVLFGGLAFLLRKPLRAMLGKRGLAIGESLRQADEAKADAEGKQREAEVKLSSLEEDIRRMMDTARSVAEREKDRIAAQAAAEAERIRRFTQDEIDRLAKSGLQELKAYAAEKATAAAGERIRKRLTPAEQVALIDKSIERLSELHEKPGPR